MKKPLTQTSRKFELFRLMLQLKQGKKIMLGLALLLTGFLANAQTQGLENVVVEKYYVSDAADAAGSSGILPVGSVTYRVYVDMLPGYNFQALYGVPGHTFSVSTNTSFFNNEDYGTTTPTISTTNVRKNSALLDSYFSCGGAANGRVGVFKSEDTDGSPGNAQSILQNNDPSTTGAINIGNTTSLSAQDGMIPGTPSSVTFIGLTTELDPFDGTSQFGSSFSTTNGSVAALGGATGATAANRLLVGQFTTNGCFSFQLNIQIGTPTGGVQNYVANNATGNEIAFAACTYPQPAAIITNTGATALVCPASSLTLYATGGGTYLWDNSSSDPIRTVTTAGTYSVVVTTPNGCTSNASIIVTSTPDATNPTVYLQSSAMLAGITGSSTVQTPYVQPLKTGVQFKSILSANESVGGYKMSGIPDGTGAFDNGNGTFTLLVNHEIPNTNGVVRAHGSKGAFVSKWIINKSSLSVISGSDLMQQTYLWNGSDWALAAPGTAAFSRFCSADLPPVSAFYNYTTGKGTRERIFMNGEESGTEGRALGHIVTGPNAGKSYQLPYLGKMAFENAVASPATGDTTLVGCMDDGTGGQVYFYMGTKTTIGNEIDKAGLHNGKQFGVLVNGFSIERVNATTINSAPAPNTPFSLVDLGNVSGITGAVFNTNSNTAGITQFSRPEDGSWDPSNPNDFYFVTTDQIDQVNDGVGSQIGRSRLWRLRFTDVTHPSLGGTITAVLDGTEGQNMCDNITIDNFGHIILQEDVGGQAHNGKVWQYTIATDQLTLIAKHDPARFGDIGVPATSPYNNDEESSGVIDASAILGPGMFLSVDQAHSNIGMPTDVFENGQIFAFFNPESYGTGNAKDTVKVYVDNSCTVPVVSLGTPSAADNCSIASLTNNAPGSYSIGNTNVVWTATDGSGNTATITQVVVVADTTKPVITCVSDITQCNPVVTFSPSVTDNCSATVICTPASGSTFALGLTSVTCTATDPSGNSASCSFNVTINESPVISACPSNITQCDNHVATWTDPTATGTPTPTVVCSPASGSTFATGTTTVTCTATNSCGSSSCSFTVTINESPVISACPSDITQCGNQIATWTDPTATGTPTPTVVCSPASGSTFAIGTTSVTCTASNSCGTSSCSFNVTIHALPTVTASNVSGCAGTSIALSGSPAGGSFSVANPYTGPSTTYTYSYTDGNGCSNTSAPATITVNPLPTVSFSGLAASYYVTASSATLTGSPAGGTFSGPGISGNTFSPSIAGVGGPYTITYSYTDGNGCSNSSSQQTSVLPCTLPAMPGSISVTGGAKVCPGDSRTYKVTNVVGMTYNWIPPTGAVIVSGQGTHQVVITFNASFGTTGTLSVTANNVCGASTPRTLLIYKNIPSMPGVITGATIACPSSSHIYSVANVSGVTYNWTAPANASIASGQGTNSVTVNFSASFISGTITVNGTYGCGNSANRTLAIVSKPATPGVITGQSALVCANSTHSYSVPNVSGVTYNWTAPANATITSGQGTNSVTVNFLAGFTYGNLSVNGTYGCGNSTNRVLALTSVPSTPGTMTGILDICGQSNVSYSVPNVSGVTYNWVVPAGAVINGGQGTNAITVNFTAMTGGSGIVKVSATNACGSSQFRSVTVRKVPATPGVITGNTSVTTCTNETYSINPAAGATSYIWTVPTGSSIVSGQGTTSISVQFGSTSGQVTVKGSNACGNGSAKTKNVTVSGCTRNANTVTGSSVNVMNVYPNPTSGLINLNFNATVKESYKVIITDIAGKVVYENNATSVVGLNEMSADLKYLAKGLYELQLVSTSINFTQKIVLQ